MFSELSILLLIVEFVGIIYTMTGLVRNIKPTFIYLAIIVDLLMLVCLYLSLTEGIRR